MAETSSSLDCCQSFTHLRKTFACRRVGKSQNDKNLLYQLFKFSQCIIELRCQDNVNDDNNTFCISELSNRDGEIQKLNAESTRAKELDKVVQRQTFELEQLKKQLSDQQLNNHADENNKIEIRNLQNALDSSKKELEAQRVLVTDYKVKLDDLTKQLSESKQLTNSKSAGDSFLVRHQLKGFVLSLNLLLMSWLSAE